jgi:hypothetical protein
VEGIVHEIARLLLEMERFNCGDPNLRN